MPIKRETIIIGLPIDNQGIKAQSFFENGAVSVTSGKIYIQLYLNPESFNINEKKLINLQLTKGGYNVQYWGEEVQRISIGGSTGSGGIEYINLLRSIYRHEQIQFKKILNERLKILREEARLAAIDAENDIKPDYANDVGGFLTGAADFLTGGLISGLTNGFDTLTDIITGDFASPNRKEYSNFSTSPSLASLATSLEIYYQGEVFRGYFENFSVNEAAQNPGLFSWSTSFVCLNRSGERKNFMPWHRSPVNKDTGEAQKASIPVEGQRLDELSFSYGEESSATISSSFVQNNENINSESIPLKSVNRRRT